MIIVEGPDGAGKTRLVERLEDRFAVERRPRAVRSSLEGPVDDLCRWVFEDTKWHHTRIYAGQPVEYDWISIYDRHPLISEPIYGPLVRGKLPDEWSYTWMNESIRALEPISPLIIFCMPPLEQVLANIKTNPDEQMPGVYANMERIYALYTATVAMWSGRREPVGVFLHDYTSVNEEQLHMTFRLIEVYKLRFDQMVGMIQVKEKNN